VIKTQKLEKKINGLPTEGPCLHHRRNADTRWKSALSAAAYAQVQGFRAMIDIS
jgi:hypothetical protein